MAREQSPSSLAGSFRIFKVAGVTVYLHWSWLVVGYLELKFRKNTYTSMGWNIAEYVALFAIVLLHEFGHALACRQVGGIANEIVLWPLGGIAYVRPPARPCAWLWSIAAGPLVNLVLVPVTVAAYLVGESQQLQQTDPDAHHFLQAVAGINLGLLIFNILPIYPLDGGQILQALLWFVIGRPASLVVVSVIGLIGAACLLGLALLGPEMSLWIAIVAVFMGIRCLAGFRQAQLLALVASAPRHRGAACPACGVHALRGDFWTCNACQTQFDMFTERGVCPRCGTELTETQCPDCLQTFSIRAWFAAVDESDGRNGQEPESWQNRHGWREEHDGR